MEYAPDGGRQWRQPMRLWIQQSLNHQVYDPSEEAQRILSKEELRNLPRWKTTEEKRFRNLMRFIINHDLDVMANQADYVVCYWDEAAARGGGTQAELTAAFRKGIPVYIVAEWPPDQMSGWVLGCSDKIFSTFDKLKLFLAATYRKKAQPLALRETR
jgi:hypothetical protein